MGSHGGARVGAGRKTKAEESKTTEIFIIAIKEIFNVETNEDAKKEFTKDLLTFERGKMFVAEHLFGKPKEIIEQKMKLENFSLKDVIDFE